MAREYFCAYHSFSKSVEPLNDAERGRLFMACLQYSESGIEPELRGNERFVFPTIREQIDRDRDKYEQVCENNRKNGSLGGSSGRKRSVAVGSECPPNAPQDKEEDKEERKEISLSSGDDILSVDDLFEKTYAIYPRKEGKAKGKAAYKLYLTKGKEISGDKYKFDHQQIFIAIQQYAEECADKDRQYIQQFTTFMNGTLVDYIERTSADYKRFMSERYGGQGARFRYE